MLYVDDGKVYTGDGEVYKSRVDYCDAYGLDANTVALYLNKGMDFEDACDEAYTSVVDVKEKPYKCLGHSYSSFKNIEVMYDMKLYTLAARFKKEKDIEKIVKNHLKGRYITRTPHKHRDKVQELKEKYNLDSDVCKTLRVTGNFSDEYCKYLAKRQELRTSPVTIGDVTYKSLSDACKHYDLSTKEVVCKAMESGLDTSTVLCYMIVINNF